jgi:hypothetical protein
MYHKNIYRRNDMSIECYDMKILRTGEKPDKAERFTQDLGMPPELANMLANNPDNFFEACKNFCEQDEIKSLIKGAYKSKEDPHKHY